MTIKVGNTEFNFDGDEVIEMVKSHSDDDKMMNEMYVGWIENMKE